MQDIQIRCVRKTERYNPHERISGVGGLNEDGTRWFLPGRDAIAGVKAGKWRFWTVANGKNLWIVLAETAQGIEYLKGEPDDIQPSNLLALPDCPVRRGDKSGSE
jgi:hypothetical protein